MQLTALQRRRLHLRADAGIHQSSVEMPGSVGRIERDRMLTHAGRAKVVALAAGRDHEGVVRHASSGRDLATFFIDVCGDLDLPPCAIEPDHLADAVIEVVPMRLGKIIELVDILIHTAGRDLVQQRFPDVGSRSVDQGNSGLTESAEPIAEPRGQFGPTLATPTFTFRDVSAMLYWLLRK